MIKKIYFLPVLLLTLFFIACDETEQVGKYENWQARNDAFMDSLQHVYDTNRDRDLYAVTDSRTKAQIFFKKIPGYTATQELKPILTSTISVFYRGVLLDEAVFGNVPSPRYYTSKYEDLTVFDSNFKEKDPSVLDRPHVAAVNSFVSGWIEILQNMQIGERWEIYVPYSSGYGASDYGSIPAYSTLIFDIQLVDITEY